VQTLQSIQSQVASLPDIPAIVSQLDPVVSAFNRLPSDRSQLLVTALLAVQSLNQQVLSVRGATQEGALPALSMQSNRDQMSCSVASVDARSLGPQALRLVKSGCY
jgi:hypothetical protein